MNKSVDVLNIHRKFPMKLWSPKNGLQDTPNIFSFLLLIKASSYMTVILKSSFQADISVQSLYRTIQMACWDIRTSLSSDPLYWSLSHRSKCRCHFRQLSSLCDWSSCHPWPNNELSLSFSTSLRSFPHVIFKQNQIQLGLLRFFYTWHRAWLDANW